MHFVLIALGQDIHALMSIPYQEVGAEKHVGEDIHKTNNLLGPPR
tara:strand:- start:30 stop:164 length:135 start_codon:yes stop_codon:yes gene_type:complete